MSCMKSACFWSCPRSSWYLSKQLPMAGVLRNRSPRTRPGAEKGCVTRLGEAGGFQRGGHLRGPQGAQPVVSGFVPSRVEVSTVCAPEHLLGPPPPPP